MQAIETQKLLSLAKNDGGIPVAKKATVPLAKTFGLRVPPETQVPCLAAGHPFEALVPQRENHTFEMDFVRDLVGFVGMPTGEDPNVLHYMGDGLMITGPTGCGKTTGVLQYAARVNWPVIRVNLNKLTEVSDLFGSMGLRATTTGQTVTRFKYGPVALAMLIGALLILDELDLAEPAILAALNPILEGQPLVLAENGGEIVSPHPDFRLIATGNSNGGGDETGVYHGVVTQNLAFMDRFQVIKVDYLQPETEKAILQAKFGESFTDESLDAMIRVANDVRAAFVDRPDEMPVTFSTRTLIRWGHLVVSLANSNAIPDKFRYALKRALMNRAPAAAAESIDQFGRLAFDVSRAGIWEGKVQS